MSVFEVSVSKPTTTPSYSEPISLCHQTETLSFPMLDHKMVVVAARVPTSGAKGQDQKEEREACVLLA